MRSGKTLAMTRHVVRLLNEGEIVYTNYKVNWNPDAPMSFTRSLLHRLGVRKKRYNKSNLRTFKDWTDVSNVSNCTVALDEGWQYFDSYQKLPMDKRMRLYQSGKWELNFLYTVQRYMMTDINLRWSTDEFFESTLYKIPFLPYPLIIYRQYDLEEDSDGAKLARKAVEPDGKVVDLAVRVRWLFTRKKHFDAYDTTEDIYATEEYRAGLSQKVDARASAARWTYDPLPTVWSYFKVKKKHDDRRLTQPKKRVRRRQPKPVLARVRRGSVPRKHPMVNTDGVRVV